MGGDVMKLISIERIVTELPPEDGWRKFEPTGESIITIERGGKVEHFSAYKIDCKPRRDPFVEKITRNMIHGEANFID